MLARIRRSMAEADQGFTLIELLVVMIIIGILAAIAIPVFLNQRKKAVDSATKSDLRTIANEMETVFTDNQGYVGVTATTSTNAGTPVTIGTTPVKVSSGNYFTVKLLKDATTVAASSTVGAVSTDATGYCITGLNAKGSDATNGFIYNSLEGGLKTGSATVICPL